MEDAPKLMIRDQKPSDLSFLHSCFYHGRKKDGLRHGLNYRDLHLISKRLMEAFLADPTVRFYVATPGDDHDLIAGVMVTQGRELLWHYTRLSMRGYDVDMDLARAAFGASGAVKVVFNDEPLTDRLAALGYTATWEPVPYGQQATLAR